MGDTLIMSQYIATARYGFLRKTLIAILVIIPTLVLIGWLFDLRPLYTLTPGGSIAMNPLAAVLFIGIGLVGHYLQRHQDARQASRYTRITLYGFAAILLLVSILIDLRSLSGVAVYPDLLLFGSRVQDGLMSLGTAACFGFSGVILISFVWVKPIRFGVVRLSAMMIMALSVTAILGYILDQPAFYSLGIFSPMSFWSAVLFACISGSMLRLNFKDAQLNRSVLVGIASILTLMMCGMSMAIHSFRSQEQMQVKLEQANTITTNVNDIVSVTLNAEVGVRGYLLTGNEAYLDPYTSAQSHYETALAGIESAVEDNDHATALRELRKLTEQKNAGLAAIIARAQKSGVSAGLAALTNGQDEMLVDQIRASAKKILDDTHQDMAAIIGDQNRISGQTQLYVGISGGIAFVLLLLIMVLLMRETMARIATENTLKVERNEALEGKAKDEAILRSIGDGVFALDENNKVILFNRAAEKISGYKAKKVLGKTYSDILHFTDEDGLTPKDAFIREAQAGHSTKMANHTVLRSGMGTHVPVADSAAPIQDASGKHLGIIVVFRDVTKQRQLEKSKDEFISLASHQLRTPLTSIRLFAEMLLQGQTGKLSHGQREYIEMIETSTLRMIKLVGDMLNISRIELGRIKVESVATDVSELIRSHCAEVEPLVKQKKIHLVVTSDSHLPNILIDPVLFDQIIHNLLANAVRYTPEKGTVTVHSGYTDKGLTLTVKDTGIGIPESAKPHIFERFFRAGNAVNAIGEGTGLGLYLVKLILDSSGGSIRFESREGEGTTFTVYIPPGGMKARSGNKTLN